MYAEERQHEIVTLARGLGRVAVTELATRFGVTPETIRRDLDALAGRGLLSRVHGGAVPVDRLFLAETPLGQREASSQEEKVAIATRALALLPERDGLTVIVDAGTTTTKLCELLPSRVVTVVTNSVASAAALADRRDLEVFMVGGLVRGLTHATVGEQVLEFLSRLRVDVAFLGANGFSVEHGFSTPDPAEAAVKRAMVKAAREAFVLADATKFGADYLVQFAALDEVDGLVTDGRMPSASREALTASGVRVEIA